MAALLWFRRDLRLADNPALAAAVASGLPVIPVFVLDDEDAGEWAAGGASRWWLHGALASLDGSLRARGARLVLRRGKASQVIARLARETDAKAVFWNRRYEPWATARDAQIKAALQKNGVAAQSFNAALLAEPWTVSTKDGGPYRVFTPFWKSLRALDHAPPQTKAPKHFAAPAAWPASDALASWHLQPTAPDWAVVMRQCWQPGEDQARAMLRHFVESTLSRYHETRDRPGLAGTSRLSPHLHFGEIGPRQIWHAVQTAVNAGSPSRGAEVFLSEIGWREFSHHLLHHFPDLVSRPLRSEFLRFPWADAPGQLRAWQRGRTGYPIVDAGMRELWATGWMHNRVRMIVASFLTKHLRIDWRDGAKWFWDTLVDADLANNSCNWQWVAGCGADAAPYFRIFNPVLQGAKFDPDGAYVRRWVPELAKLPASVLHAPWTARPVELADAGVTLGKTYPQPIVDHATARAQALAAFQRIKTGN